MRNRELAEFTLGDHLPPMTRCLVAGPLAGIAGGIVALVSVGLWALGQMIEQMEKHA